MLCIMRAGGRVTYIAADLTKEAEITALAEETLRQFGEVDIVVNNAGVSHRRPAGFAVRSGAY